jgi:uncharacterized protein
VIAYYGVSGQGNFEGRNVLHLPGGPDAPEPEGLSEARQALYAARSERVRPGLDDKRLASWNALMISALAETGAALEREDYLAAAIDCAEFLLGELRTPDGRLLRTWKDGRGHIDAYLEDHAYLLEALQTLYEATFDPRWYREARAIADTMLARFADEDQGGFFTTAADQDTGFARRKDLDDSPIPAAGSSAAFGLLRLALVTGEAAYEERALGVLRVLAPIVGRHPHGFGHALQAFDFHLSRVDEVALVGSGAEFDDLARVMRRGYRPHVVLAGGPSDGVPLLEGREPVDGQAAAYVCQGFVCQAPVTSTEDLTRALD